MQQIIGILEQESKGKYSSPSSPYSHPYLRKLNNCLRDCNISGDHVKEWIHILTQHFQQSNRLGLPSIKPAATAEYTKPRGSFAGAVATETEVKQVLLDPLPGVTPGVKRI